MNAEEIQAHVKSDVIVYLPSPITRVAIDAVRDGQRYGCELHLYSYGDLSSAEIAAEIDRALPHMEPVDDRALWLPEHDVFVLPRKWRESNAVPLD